VGQSDERMPFAQRRAEEEALNRPIAGAQYLQALARGLPNNEVDLDHPPSNLTADQRAVIDYVRNTPALRNALDVAGIGGKADGIISANDCDTFIDNERDHADAASNAYNAYLGAHPNSDPQSGELTRCRPGREPVASCSRSSALRSRDRKSNERNRAGR